jgi:hypothetical protein
VVITLADIFWPEANSFSGSLDERICCSGGHSRFEQDSLHGQRVDRLEHPGDIGITGRVRGTPDADDSKVARRQGIRGILLSAIQVPGDDLVSVASEEALHSQTHSTEADQPDTAGGFLTYRILGLGQRRPP